MRRGISYDCDSKTKAVVSSTIANENAKGPQVKKAQNYISYLRVSTKRQGISGLGLDAQRQSVGEYIQRQEGSKMLGEYVEVETGKSSERAQLAAAIEHCRAARATLLVAKLDRLSRNVAFLSNIMDSGLDFVCCDNPHATRLTIHIFAAVAEQEATATSERTRLALSQAKKRGVLLGSNRPGHWEGKEERRLLGSRKGVVRAAITRGLAARSHNSLAVSEAVKMRTAGQSWQDAADSLNKKGLVTSRGNSWSKSSLYSASKSFLDGVLDRGIGAINTAVEMLAVVSLSDALAEGISVLTQGKKNEEKATKEAASGRVFPGLRADNSAKKATDKV